MPVRQRCPSCREPGRQLTAALPTLALLALLAGCATPAIDPQHTLKRWTQLGAGGSISLRAIVGAADECPTAIVDGQLRRLSPRATATPLAGSDTRTTGNPAFDADFAVTACELTLPASARQATIDGQPMPMPRADPRRIVVVGDTGCRIKVPASGVADPIQDCASPTAWPWQRIAAAAARTQPDLVIHLGDYHYREYCDQPALCAPLHAEGVPIGYGWAGWNADFFSPAAALLATAPWIVVRGNHENCDRAGEGWMRFLSPLPYRPCPNQTDQTASRSLLANNLTAAAYHIDLGQRLRLVVADNAAAQDYRPLRATPDDAEVFAHTLAALPSLPADRSTWLLIHKPVWYDLLDPAAQPNALQAGLHQTLPASVQFIFSGHQHAFQTINFARAADPVNHPAGRPAQIIVGASGTQLEAFDPLSPLYERIAGSQERAQADGRRYEGVVAHSGIVLNRYSFLLLDRTDDGWAATLIDGDGNPIDRCRLDEPGKAVSCGFPADP
ncbi:MAG: metallophosphoesterase [Candidatus Accumulibacter sp. UW27]|jgi:hypothetical protein